MHVLFILQIMCVSFCASKSILYHLLDMQPLDAVSLQPVLVQQIWLLAGQGNSLQSFTQMTGLTSN